MKDIPPNLHRFNLTTLAVFDALYSAFPKPICLAAHSIGIDAAPDDASTEDMFQAGVEADDVLTWLAEEGFIRYDGKTLTGEFYQVRLTLRGLTVLGYIPTAINAGEPKQTIIEKIRKTVGAGASKASEDAAKMLITELFNLSLTYGGLAMAGIKAASL